MISGLFVSLQAVSVAQPEPSTLMAAWEKIFKRSKEPYSLSRSSARAPRRFASAALASGCQVLPEDIMEEMPPDVEGQFFIGRFRVKVRVFGYSLVESLQDGIGPVYVGRVVLVVMQREKFFGYVWRKRVITIGEIG